MKAMYSIKDKTVETKTFPFQLKSINEDEGTVTGHLSTFGNVDLQKDRVIKGAFKKTLADAYSRKKNGRKFLVPDLWMHDPDKPTGGVIEASEDSEGLLVTMQYDITVNAAGFPNNPTATMVFSGHKMGYIDELSMGYVAVQKEFDGGVRNLKEVQLIECSAVTMLFAANPEALTTGVKSMQIKGASGKTTWPLADRDMAWDNGSAHNAIVKKATKEDGSIDQALMKSVHFWYDESAADKITSYKLLFCDVVSGEIKAIPRGIFACTGGHGLAVADIPEGDIAGIKSKIATYYKRMAKEFDDDSIKVPWSDDDKRRTMAGQRKDFNDLFMAAQAADCLEDWCDLTNTLTQTMLQIFGMGDSPQADMTACLEQFGTAINKWMEDALACNLAQYINDQGYCGESTPYVPYNMRTGSDYGYMSRSAPLQGSKAGRAISAANQSVLEQHQEGMKAHLVAMNTEIKGMQQKISDLTQLWQDEGQGDAYGNDKSRVTRREPPQTLTSRNVQPLHKSTVNDEAIAELEALFS